MQFDLVHTIVTGLLVAAVLFAVEYAGFLRNTPRLNRVLIRAGAIFVVVFALDIVWPYGATF